MRISRAIIAAIAVLTIAAGASFGNDVDSVACVSSADLESQPRADSPEAVLANYSSELVTLSPQFRTVGERERVALLAAAARDAHVVDRLKDQVIARTTDARGNLTSEFVVMVTPDGSWQLTEFAIGLTAAVCDALASRS
jgi:hypothetical protein